MRQSTKTLLHNWSEERELDAQTSKLVSTNDERKKHNQNLKNRTTTRVFGADAALGVLEKTTTHRNDFPHYTSSMSIASALGPRERIRQNKYDIYLQKIMADGAEDKMHQNEQELYDARFGHRLPTCRTRIIEGLGNAENIPEKPVSIYTDRYVFGRTSGEGFSLRRDFSKPINEYTKSRMR